MAMLNMILERIEQILQDEFTYSKRWGLYFTPVLCLFPKGRRVTVHQRKTSVLCRFAPNNIMEIWTAEKVSGKREKLALESER